MNRLDPLPTQTDEFSEVLRCYGDMAYRMAMQLTRGREAEARDLVQDGFIKIWRHWKIQRPNSFRGWMYRLLHNLYMDSLRHEARRPAFSLDAPAPSGEGTFGDTLSDSAPALDQPMEMDARQRLVRRALERLERDFRIPVMLCDMEGLSYEEIAQIMSCPVGTVRSRIFRGRQMLRRWLEPSFEEARS